MELKVNGYIKLAEDLDCGLKVLEEGTPFRIENIAKMVTVVNELIGGGGFSKGEIEEYFVESSEKEYNIYRDAVLEAMTLEYGYEDEE